MSQKPEKQKPASQDEDWDDDTNSEYSEMERLEMLESLREDMEELGVNTLQEVIARIEELHQRLDAR
ncbi:MAG TPA: hypothetical protein VGM01_11370 [Ktedonobacteraceae bacterium]|jgi:hypothetical protein